jgi:hypothetical protein
MPPDEVEQMRRELMRIERQDGVRARRHVDHGEVADAALEELLLLRARQHARGRIEAEHRGFDLRQQRLGIRMAQEPVESAKHFRIGRADLAEIPVAELRVGALGKEARRAIDALGPLPRAERAERLLAARKARRVSVLALLVLEDREPISVSVFTRFGWSAASAAFSAGRKSGRDAKARKRGHLVLSFGSSYGRVEQADSVGERLADRGVDCRRQASR